MNKKHTILVVDDDVPLLKAVCGKLEREGFQVFEAKNGQEGLDLALSNHPDLILLDIIMPVMDGMSMFEKLRQDAWGKNAKVIVLTNLSDNTKLAEALELKSYGYLVKIDWKIEDVVAKIKETLGK